MPLIVGTAGWAVPRQDAERFPAEGTSLQRYATAFGGVEINSSFHGPHRQATWARWSDSVPSDFKFAVKIPKTISHQHKLIDCDAVVTDFIGQVAALGEKLAILLLQLPPKLEFDPDAAADFLQLLTSSTSAAIVCEPRHPSWFEAGADALLERFRVARVAADPALSGAAAEPGGWRGLSYWRLHGSPHMYRSSYDPDRLASYARRIREEQAAGRAAWCMFDNTAASAATGDALALQELV
jgi:uncharacterized protein YecE (DUF72 family)